MVQIITDSSTLYTPEEAKKRGFEVSPLCVSIADLEDRDLLVDMDAFYGKIAEGNHPKSSQPPIGEVLDLYEKYKDAEIINIAMADGLSGTYQSACGAVEMVDNKDNITVINSKTLCGPHRYMLDKALEMQKNGSSAQEIIAWLRHAADNNASFLIPQDFDFLRRGGRLTPLAATFGSILKLKPVMTQTSDGKKLDKFAVKRTLKTAVAAIIEHWQKEIQPDERHIIYVSHARVLNDANKVIAQLKEAFPKTDIELLDLGAAFVTQGGPGCIAIQYIEK